MTKTISLLIVDDDANSRALVIHWLQELTRHRPYSLTLIEAVDGLEALELIKRQKFDILLTDIRMPRMDGLDLVKAIKSLPDKPAKVFIITGWPETPALPKLLKDGDITGVIDKTLNLKELSSVLDEIGKRHDG